MSETFLNTKVRRPFVQDDVLNAIFETQNFCDYFDLFAVNLHHEYPTKRNLLELNSLDLTHNAYRGILRNSPSFIPYLTVYCEPLPEISCDDYNY